MGMYAEHEPPPLFVRTTTWFMIALIAFWLADCALSLSPWRQSTYVTLGWLAALAAVAAVREIQIRRWRKRLSDVDYQLCPHCGYQLRGLPEWHRCPECGKVFHIEGVRRLWRFALTPSRRDPPGGFLPRSLREALRDLGNALLINPYLVVVLIVGLVVLFMYFLGCGQ